MICAIVTAAGGFPSDPSDPKYKARTDARIEVLKEAKWFRVPYPGDKKRWLTLLPLLLVSLIQQF